VKGTDSFQWTICHQLPTRLRVRHPILRHDPRLSRLLEQRLNRLEGVWKAQVRPTTGSVILSYDPRKMETRHIILRLSADLAEALNRLAGKADPGRRRIRHKPYPAPSLACHLINAVALSAFMAFVLIKRLFFGSPLRQGPFSLMGAVAFAGALPLLRRVWLDFRSGKRVGLFPFLTAACGLAVAMGEALTALEIIWVLALGMLLETYATDRARRAIGEILQVAPENALVLRAGAEKETLPAEIQADDTVVVRAGRKIPVDGPVIEGKALVDEAHITGRSQPELRRPRDWVYAGTVVQQGMIHVRARNVGEETYLSRMADLVEASLANRTEAEKRADILGARLTRMGLVCTGGTLILTGSVARAFSVMLVMACPCATVLAASTAVSAAIANAAGRGIFIKGGLYLERISSIDTVCFDKTGTITTAFPQVTGIFPLTRRHNPLKILAAAAGAEAGSHHPLAKALIQEAALKGVTPEAMSEFQESIGRGVSARAGSGSVLVGNPSLMKSRGVETGPLETRAAKCAETGQTVIYVAKNDRLQGILCLSNTAREGADKILKTLRKEGITHFSLISGDAKPIVRTLSKRLGFDDSQGSMLPDDKARYMERLVSEGRLVLMVGDGVNDALALSKATVGVAMGAGGSEVAVETADIALAGDDLQGLVFLRLLSHQTLRIMEQNFWMANATNLAGILLGASGWLPPVMAGILHVGHTLGIMLNSGRLMQWRPENHGRGHDI